jgi:NAD(P)-dependent dehydrogenase (short-subunit alcohol dehydrogenase family)
VIAAFDKILSTGAAADIIVNNSGLSREDWLVKMDEDDWDLVMDTNLKGVWRVAKAGADALMAAGKPGSIINIASITAFRPSHTIGAYATSKAAVRHLTHSMALEWARAGIRVNSIAPGYFETEINADYTKSEAGAAMIKRIPMRRLGYIEELAGPLLLLASDAGAYMTGSVIVVDGGHLQSAL